MQDFAYWQARTICFLGQLRHIFQTFFHSHNSPDTYALDIN